MAVHVLSSELKLHGQPCGANGMERVSYIPEMAVSAFAFQD